MDSNQTSGSYLRQLGDTKKRPVIVVSMNIRNELSDSVIVVPFTSDIAGGGVWSKVVDRVENFGEARLMKIQLHTERE